MIMDQLKVATARAHARTEAALPPMEILATSRGYRWYLMALHCFHAAWEPEIWSTISAEDAALEPALRRKLPSLERDLAALGVTIARSPRRTIVGPSFPGVSSALGALYVLEGASLGGRVVERRIAGPLGITPTDGGAYLHGYGDDTGSLWRRFGQIMNSRVSHVGEREEVIEGALACFGALETWFAAYPMDLVLPLVASNEA